MHVVTSFQLVNTGICPDNSHCHSVAVITTFPQTMLLKPEQMPRSHQQAVLPGTEAHTHASVWCSIRWQHGQIC